MTEWWTSLDLMMKILWGITLSATTIFVIQTVMTFLGADSGGDFDIDTDVPDGDMGPGEAAGTDGMNLYTFRNFVNFFLGFGWTAVLMREQIASTTLLFILAFVVGVALVAAVMYLFKWLSSMQQSGNINVFEAAPGCQGTVYLSIPAERQGEGKVQITINGSVREYNAVTDGDALSTGTPIKVSEVINASTLLVEPLNSMII